MPRSVNHTGTPYKYQLTIELQKAELTLSNPLGKLSLVFRINNQKVESLQRPKTLKEILLNELLTTTTTIYEVQPNVYEESAFHVDMFLNQTKSSKIIGVADINITQMLNEAEKEEKEETFNITLEKSPEYKAKLSLKIQTKCLGVEVVEKPNFSKKRGHSNLPNKTIDLDENKSDIWENEEMDGAMRQKTHQMNKNRSVTPTPGGSSLAKQNVMRSEIIEKKKNPIVVVNKNTSEQKKSEEGSDVEIINKLEESKEEKPNNKRREEKNTKIEKKEERIIKTVEKPSKIEKSEEKAIRNEKTQKVQNIEKPVKNEKTERIEKEKVAYNLKTPPSKKEKLENISTIPQLSETLNTTETSVIQKDLDDIQTKRRDTFGFKSTGFEAENNNILTSLISEENDNNKQQEDFKKLEVLKDENKNLLKEKVRLESLLNEVKEVKKGYEKEQERKMMNLGRENADLKEELQRKTREFEILSSKSKEMRTLLEEKEIEVKRLEDLTAGLQREILHIKKEMNEKEGDSWNKEEIEEMKGLIKRLEQEVEGKNLEKAEILKKKEEEFREIKKANEMLMENNTKLQQNLLAFSKENATEKISLKEDVKKLEEHRENLKKELLRKDGKIIELEENLKNLQVKYVKTKEEVADIVNLVFEKGGLELMEEIEGYMVNLSEISKDLEAKLSEKR